MISDNMTFAFPLLFLLIIAIIIFAAVAIVMGIKQWSRNNHSLMQVVSASIVAKRIYINEQMNHLDDNGVYMSSSSTDYYITFEAEGGDRMEFHVNGIEYGQLTEGDFGRLTFQGMRYKSFVRL